VEKVAEELRAFQELFDNDREFQMELTSPLVRGDQYLPILAEVYPELGIETEAAKDLIAELVTNASAGKLKKILEDYDRLAQFNKKTVKARVTSAQPLTSEQLQRLREVLQKQVDSDETLDLEQDVDESLLGGLKVDMNDRSIDLTVAQKLGELDRALRAS
jgi:F-type H+-transporting ATPase subunit O